MSAHLHYVPWCGWVHLEYICIMSHGVAGCILSTSALCSHGVAGCILRTEAFVSAHQHICIMSHGVAGCILSIGPRCCLVVPHTGVLFCHCRALGCRSPVTSRISCSFHCMQSCQWSTLMYYQQVVGSVYKLRLTCLFFLCLHTHKKCFCHPK